MATLLFLIFITVLPTSFLVVQAQLSECVGGGGGPCINGLCLTPGLVCIKTTGGDICCEPSKIRPVSPGSSTPRISTPIVPPIVTPTPQVPTVSTSGTTERGCFDRVDSRTGKSACPLMVRLCGDGRYRTVMQEQCPKTCGFCSVGGTTMTPPPYTGCQDLVNGATGKSDCGSRYEYCKNPLYMELMAQQCPKTCGYCP
ncbi:hypothetical protein V3C99_016786 [Haemonchus contortus]